MNEFNKAMTCTTVIGMGSAIVSSLMGSSNGIGTSIFVVIVSLFALLISNLP